MNALIALVRHDLKTFLGNRRALLMSLAAPIVLGGFMGYFFTDRGGETSKIPIALVDQDGSPVSRKLAAGLAGDTYLEVRPAALDEARTAVRKGKVSAAVVLPPKFGEAATRGFFRDQGRPEVTLLLDPSKGAEAGLVRGLLSHHAMESVSGEVFGGSQGLKLLQENAEAVEKDPTVAPELRQALKNIYRDVAQLNEQGALTDGKGQPRGLSLPYALKEETVTARTGIRYNGYAHSFAGMGVQFILFMGIEAGVGLLLLRKGSLWRRLRAAPVGRQVFLAARMISAALSAALLLLAIFLVAWLGFGVKVLGSFPGFLLVTAGFALFTGAFGLLIASLGRTPETTRGLTIMVTLVMLMLGGAWVPAFIFPAWLQKASLVMPTRWAIDGLDAMTWRGQGFEAALLPAGILAAFALAMGLLAWARFPFDEA
ncbi:MAG TPA: ABC transporter permease [Holophaga sp.]|nr:ABC transporter permease [Holophaga sp.]